MFGAQIVVGHQKRVIEIILLEINDKKCAMDGQQHNLKFCIWPFNLT
jgi:hypothetical protein